MSDDFVDLLRRGDRTAAAAALAEIARGPSISAREVPVARPNEVASIAHEGLAFLRGAAEAEAPALSEAVASLAAAELPPVFLYVFQDAWTLADRLRERISALLGAPYRVVDDAWAWQIEPGKGRGWPPHRGVPTLLDRRTPELVNVWVALTDATPERSCIHFVPLDSDPGYPHELERGDAPLDAVRAVPARAGDALYWNANVLHWGGGCSARAAGPRRSCSYTLARPDAPEALAGRVIDPRELDTDARFDLVARQIAVYGEGQPDVSQELLTWARATCALASVRS
jgi:hypothetical protein